jgi:copper chaperone CopZ
MICGMCESHVNDAIRNAFSVKQVNSSRSKGETVILSETPLDPDRLRQIVNATGYIVLSVEAEEITQKSLFGFFSKK